MFQNSKGFVKKN